jgi:hypothetical protein
MSALSPDASALLVCMQATPQRALELRTQVGWPEQRFNATLAQLVNSYPAKIESFGGVDDLFEVRRQRL